VDIDDQTAIYGEELIANANLTFDLNAESAALKSGDTLSGLGVSLVKAEGLRCERLHYFSIGIHKQ